MHNFQLSHAVKACQRAPVIRMRIFLSAILFGLCGLSLINCGTPATPPVAADFTKADSLTEYYLSLHDSVLVKWNIMINDDNEKINSLHHLVHELIVSHPENVEQLKSLEERLDQLMRMRYTQKTMSNADVVNEYDYASSSLVSVIISNTETQKEYSYNKTLQKLVEDVRGADKRIGHHRLEYDSVVRAYNKFIEENKDYLLQTDETLSLEKKPLFRVVSED
jgi:hypothetical protein